MGREWWCNSFARRFARSVEGDLVRRFGVRCSFGDIRMGGPDGWVNGDEVVRGWSGVVMGFVRWEGTRSIGGCW